MKYAYSQVKYPVSAPENGIHGQAVLQFSIDQSGQVSKIHVLRGVSAAIEQECLRLVKSMPNWQPGVEKGEAVEVQFTLPITFKFG